MEIKEKIAYVKGFAEGLNLDETKDEVKVLNKILEVLDDMADEIDELQDGFGESVNIIDAINEDLLDLEDYVYDEYDEDYASDDCSGCNGCCQDDDESSLYEVTCPQCDNKFAVSEEDLLYGEVECPECSAVLEYDFSDLFNEDIAEEEDADNQD